MLHAAYGQLLFEAGKEKEGLAELKTAAGSDDPALLASIASVQTKAGAFDDCIATIGQTGNPDSRLRRLGKAGINRHLGRRPITRGMAKSHHAHPLGGGSGRSKGNRPPCGPTGVLAKGGRTRNKKQHSTKLIIRRRMTKRFGQVL